VDSVDRKEPSFGSSPLPFSSRGCREVGPAFASQIVQGERRLALGRRRRRMGGGSARLFLPFVPPGRQTAGRRCDGRVFGTPRRCLWSFRAVRPVLAPLPFSHLSFALAAVPRPSFVPAPPLPPHRTSGAGKEGIRPPTLANVAPQNGFLSRTRTLRGSGLRRVAASWSAVSGESVGSRSVAHRAHDRARRRKMSFLARP